MAASSEDPFLCKLMSSLLLLFLWFIFVFLCIWKMLFGLRDVGIGALELPCYNGVETGGHYAWRWWYRWLLCRPRCLSPSLLMWQQLRRLRDLLLARLLWRSQLVTTARLWLLRLQPRSNSPKLQRNLGLVKEVLVESTRRRRPDLLIRQQRQGLRRILLTKFPLRPQPVASPRKVSSAPTAEELAEVPAESQT